MKKLLRSLAAAALLLVAASASAEKIPSAITLLTPEGTEVSAAKVTQSGKPMLVSLWATWCGPCVNELSAIGPKVQEWADAYGVKVVAVNTEGLSEKVLERTNALIKSRGLENIEFYFDKDNALSKAFEVRGIPFMIYVDAKGEVLGTTVGFDPQLGADHIINHLQELLKNAKAKK